MRTRDTKHHAVPSGLRVAEIGRRLHYFRGGVWRDFDSSLTAVGGNRYVADKSDFVLDADGTGLAVYDFESGKGIRFLFPRPPDRVDGRAAYWTTAAAEWKFTLNRSGMKATALITSRRGPITYNFDAQMLGGLAAPNPDGSGNLVQPAGVFVVPRSVVIGADGGRYQCGPWTRAGGRVSFDFDDTALPDDAFPYVVDPSTTFNVAAGGDDGSVARTGTTYPPTGTIVTSTTSATLLATKRLSGSTYTVETELVRWDTSSLAGSVITAAVLRLWSPNAPSNSDSRDITVEWYSASNWPIDNADWTSTVGTDAHAGTAVSTFTAGASHDLDLSNLGSINTAGYTGVRLHVSGGQPTGFNIAQFSSFEDGVNPVPKLVVTYQAAPLVTVDVPQPLIVVRSY